MRDVDVSDNYLLNKVIETREKSFEHRLKTDFEVHNGIYLLEKYKILQTSLALKLVRIKIIY